MGSSASKAAKAKPPPSLSQSPAARKYPTRTPPIKPREPRQPAPERGWLHPDSTADPHLSQESESSGADPSLASRLQAIGPVVPQNSFSNPSTNVDLTPRAPLRDPKLSQDSPNDPFAFQRTLPRDNTTTSHFQPSASNPAQSIFPSDPRQNPAVSLLTARYRLAEAAEVEFSQTGKSTFKGREFLDVLTITQILVLRERGTSASVIEEKLGLKRGIVARLGRRGIVEAGTLLEEEV